MGSVDCVPGPPEYDILAKNIRLDFVHNFKHNFANTVISLEEGALLEMYSQPIVRPAKCQACRRIHNKSVVMGNAVRTESVF